MADSLEGVSFLVGTKETLLVIDETPARKPFDDVICDFLNSVSKRLMKDPRSKAYPDVITLGFWLRRASLSEMKSERLIEDKNIRIGRGMVFHIAPSNVPVNFAYSLAAGLLTGNANVVRVPSKPFAQVDIIADVLNSQLAEYSDIAPYVVLVRYERSSLVNDALSSIADTRIVWGGDSTIAELRKSALPPRSTEITFADRFSLLVISADEYLRAPDKESIALGFFNDTYLSDQNACTSPRIVIWIGDAKAEAKELFWKYAHELVKTKYEFQTIYSINKLSDSYLIAQETEGVHLTSHGDNLIIRIAVDTLNANTMNHIGNCGLFYEYDCDDILDLRVLCNDRRCQTISLLGDMEELKPLLESGIKGVDRVTPIGSTMNFELTWDGYDLVSQLTRTIALC